MLWHVMHAQDRAASGERSSYRTDDSQPPSSSPRSMSRKALALLAGSERGVCAARDSKISADVGSSEVFDQSIASFPEDYADQNERDHAALVEAIATARVQHRLSPSRALHRRRGRSRREPQAQPVLDRPVAPVAQVIERRSRPRGRQIRGFRRWQRVWTAGGPWSSALRPSR